MTDAPERIWAREAPVCPNRDWHDATNSASTARIANDCGTINPFVEYIRADKVKALVGALRELLHVQDGVPMMGTQASRRGERARTALRDLEAE